MYEEIKTLYEYQKLDKKDIDLDYIRTHQELREYFDITSNGIFTKHYCGVFQIEGKKYQILPKIVKDANVNRNINMRILNYIFVYANDLETHLNNETLSSNIELVFIESIISYFSKILFTELQRGAYKEYVTYQDRVALLKGRYLVAENIKRNFTREKVYCEYDEFSVNNELNRFFLYAVKIFLRFVNDKKFLSLIEQTLEEADYIPKLDIDNLNIRFTRLNERYKKSYDLAYMILKHLIFDIDSSNKKSFIFLFDMNKLFERFIGKVFKNSYKNVELQYKKSFNDITLIPDIFIKDPKIVIDTKYKKCKDEYTVDRNDKYQMYVYGVNFEAKDVMLIYPRHLSDLDKCLRLGEGEKEINLHLRSVDLGCCSGDCNFGEFIKNIKNQIKEIGVCYGKY